MRVDLQQLERLRHIAVNLEPRIAEATEHGWAGEEQQLRISLAAAKAEIDANNPRPTGPVLLGLPAARPLTTSD